MKSNMKRTKILILFILLLPIVGRAQNPVASSIIQGKVTSSTDGSEIIGVTISELDATNRVVSATATDANGQYVLKIKNPSDKLLFKMLGFEPTTKNIQGQKVINIVLKESGFTINQVVVTSTKKYGEGGYSIPQREIGSAMQTLDAKEFEGLQVGSVDEALQGRIAGLDIVSNSGDPGSGSSMRIRGATSINGSSEPLIVLNGVPYETQIDENFDYANSNQEQYANMLSINPDDILEITVLKDAAAAAIWGSKGANGVLSITTKKGTKGSMKADYSYRYTQTTQPQGLNMLSGGDYTMLMKQAYLNPKQDDEATEVDEYDYNDNFSDYENYNNDVDWVKAVTQTGNIHDNYLTLSGGGDRALYRVSGGYYKENGTVIGQELTRFSTRAYLEYKVSDRIRFISEISLTNSDNNRNYVMNFNKDDGNPNEDKSILGIAYLKMPNVSIYAQDVNGNNTDSYYNIPTNSSLSDDQKYLVNPVAMARLATNELKSYRILPTLRLNYDLLDPADQTLRYSMYVSFDVSNNKVRQFLPQEASNYYWTNEKVNRSDNSDSEGLTVYSDQNIAWTPRFENKDHSLLLYGSFQVNYGSSSAQGLTKYSLPSGEAIDASSDAYTLDASTSHSSWRSLAMMARAHYSYKSRYIIDGTFRRDGSTKFGEDNKFGDFPGLSLKWIATDEEFMAPTKSWLSMLAFRPSYGVSGNQPSSDYLSDSRYTTYGSYAGQSATKPSTIRLDNLKWETTSSFNYGADLGFLDDRFLFDINFYNKRTEDLLFKDVAVSSSSGYSAFTYINGGTMDNDGWEINFNGSNIVSYGKFNVDFRFNLSNNKNTLIELDQTLLDSYNGDFDYKNGSYLTRVQEGNSFGSIYGFRYKGVYQYDEYSEGDQESAPVARDENGDVLTDANGKPRSIWFNYYAKSGVSPYRFRGGDAIYEDINHDGSIDELDIVYLGNSNPKLSGGFGPIFRWKQFSCTMFFNFRYGNKIVNAARMNAENMYYDNNQCTSVNWRWRKDGDVTRMPRALYKYGYNWLGSDRFVEDGSFTRFKYLTFNYSVPPQKLKPYKLSRLSVFLTINNLYTWTKYTGVDPEVSYGSLGLSTDNAQTPRAKSFTLSVSIGL
jgi:TonB-linked SusC/RagA family outer membrane protein